MKKSIIILLTLFASSQTQKLKAPFFQHANLTMSAGTFYLTCGNSGYNMISNSNPINYNNGLVKKIVMSINNGGTNIISGGIPASVETINMATINGGRNILKIIPSSVRTITVAAYNGGENIIQAVIPPSVETLNIITCDNNVQPIITGQIPQSVKINRITSCHLVRTSMF